MYQSLQGCRAAAALLVLLFHLGKMLAAEKYFGATAFARPFAFGDAGVEFFFVLSGFIILFVHGKDFGRPSRLASYLRKRAARIYPSYWLVFGLVCLAALTSSSLRQTALPPDAATLLESLLLLPQDPAVVGGTGAPVIVVAWSLQYEMAFYAFVGCCILGRPLGLLLGALYLANGLRCHFGGGCGFPSSFFSNNRVLLFGLGMGLAALCRGGLRLPRPRLLAASGAAAFLALGTYEAVAGVDTLPIDRVLLYGLCSAMLILGLVQAEDQGMLAGERPWLGLLGNASYSLYLIHFPLLSLVCKAAMAAGLRGNAGAAAAFAAGIGACVCAAVLIHLQFERRLAAWLARIGRRPSLEAQVLPPN